MIINSNELSVVACNPSIGFDKEGYLLIRDRKEGIFSKKEVFHERWFRLRGNLLFFGMRKNQTMDPAGVIVLEQFTITLDNNTDTPFSFTLVFHGDEFSQQLAAPTEPELESWFCALHIASYGFMRSRCFYLKNRLKEKNTGFIPAFSDTSTVQDLLKYNNFKEGFIFSSHNELFLTLRLACRNLNCDVFGVIPNPVAVIYLLFSPSRWMKHAETEIFYKSTEPEFLTSIPLSKDNITMVTRIKFTVYNVIELLTDTRVIIGEAVISMGVLLQENSSTLRCPLWSLDSEEMGFIIINASNLRDVVFEDWKKGVTLVSPAYTRPQKKVIPGFRRLSLPVKLTDSAETSLHGNLKTLFHGLTSQTYILSTKLGSEISVDEVMGESMFSYLIPQQLLNIWIKEEQHMLAVLLSLGEVKCEWNERHRTAVEQHLQQINKYLHSLDMIVNNKGIYLKKSIQKMDPHLEFVPLNLHLQRIVVQNSYSKRGKIHDVFTVGAFTACSQGLSKGGLLTLMNPNNCYHLPGTKTTETTRALTNSDSLKKATDTLIRVEQLETAIELDLQELIHFSSLKRIEDLRSVIFSLKNKAHQLTQLSNPCLVEESLAIWELARPSDLKYTQSLLQISKNEQVELPNCIPKNTSSRFKRPQHLAVIKNASELHFDGPSTIYISEKKSPILNMELYSKCSGCGPGQACTTSLAEFLPSPVSSPEEFEPLELTHLNIKASIMCMASKLKSLTKLLPNSTCTTCWAVEFAPSVKKLRQVMKRLCRTAKLTYSLLALKESSRSLQTYSLRHRRDVVFSQGLTALITGILTRIWCQNIDQSSLEKMICYGLLAEFECLLSCYGDNLAMLEDMVVAIHDLNRTHFWIESTTSNSPKPRIEGNRISLAVTIPVPANLLPNLCKRNSRSCRLNVTCVFFNIGINSAADIAEKIGSASFQDKINHESFGLLFAYCQQMQKPNNSGSSKPAVTFMNPVVSKLLNQLKRQIQTKQIKNVKILHLAAEICTRLDGIRFTSCKSAKDRTGMSVTLEQAMVLQRTFKIDESVLMRFVDCMRRCGTRRTNTFKNLGVKKYAFNCLQVKALPKTYRPPLGTFGDVQN